MSATDDSLKIPIEIKTEDLDEIRNLINEISTAENDLRALKATPRKGRGSGDTGSRSAFSTPEPRETGIFGGQRDGDALPTKPRDTSSATPHQRESEFAQLRNKVNEVEKKQGNALGGVSSALGAGQQGLVMGQLIGGPQPGAGALGAIAGLAGRAFLPLTIITTIVGIAQTILSQLLAPGGPWDRRFRRVITDEVAGATSLEKKSQLNQDLKILRTQVYPNIRGEAGTSSNLRTRGIYDLGIANNMAGLGP